MLQFHPLTVTDIRNTIRDAVVITLAPQNGADFSFTQGQYLTLKQDFGGTQLRRNYSICSATQDGILQIGVKRVDGGAFSTWANTELEIGQTLHAMKPQGKFFTPLDPTAAKTYLAFAGGSGITPVLSLIKSTLHAEPGSRFALVYANRAISTIMFREDIEDLKNAYMDRLNVIHILEQDAQGVELFKGRIDTEKCNTLFQSWIDIETVNTAFICGPEPMMLTIAQSLRDHGLSQAQIKYELFSSAQTGRLKRAAPQSQTSTVKPTSATVTLDGTTRSFTMERDQTILDAAIENDIDAPFACKAGVCSTCRCKLIEGEVEMISNHALEDYEVERGDILSCQSLPLSDKVTVDYDVH